MYAREFTRSRVSAPDLVQARELLQDPNATAEALARAAEQVYTAGAAPLEDIEAMLRSALERDADYARTYPFLADVLLQKGELDEARRVLGGRGKSVSVRSTAPTWSGHGWLSKRVAPRTPSPCLNPARIPERFSPAVLRRWANSFAARGHLDAALELVERRPARLFGGRIRGVACRTG